MNEPADETEHGNGDGESFQDPVSRFRQAWQQVDSPTGVVDLKEFLPSAQTPLRLVVLLELIKTDLEIRWQRSRGLLLERYLEEFSELGGAQDLPASLLLIEYRVRQQFGDQPSLGSYRERFPRQFQELQRLLGSKETLVSSASSNLAAEPAGEVKVVADDFLPSDSGYKRIRRIGSGGFGEVWRAEAPGGVEVAIKIIFRPLSDAEAQRELQALELIKRLRHPFLLQTHAYWSLEDRLVIAMELADGSLRDRLKECEQADMIGIPITELVTYFREAAEALDYLHSQRVLHRDIKPDNLLLLKRHAKLADFGLARLLQSQRSIQASSAGTPAYMAPEVWRGRVNEHSDQYSLAATYVELRLGEPLFETRDMFELMMHHLKQTPALNTLRSAERDVLLRALAKNPPERFDSCLAFVGALEQVLAKDLADTSPGQSAPINQREAAPRPADRGSATVRDLQTPPLRKQNVVPDDFASITDKELITRERHFPSALEASPADKSAAQSKPLWRLPPKRRRLRALLFAIPLILAGVLGFVWSRMGKPGVAMPDGCRAAEGAVLQRFDDKNYYDRIEYVFSDGMPIRFVLIPRGKENPETFYMMETKVSVAHYRVFANAHPTWLRDERWKALPSNQKDENPVMGVTWDDAKSFAKWLGGALPSDQQWKYAAGCFAVQRGEGPFQGKWNPAVPTIAVGRLDKGPAHNGAYLDDVSPLGVRDLAGNGKEWTSTFARLGDETSRKPKPDEEVVVMGHSFDDSEPLRYKEIDRFPQVAPRNQSDPTIGVRVVISP